MFRAFRPQTNITSKVGPSIQKAWNFDAKVTMGTYLGRVAVGVTWRKVEKHPALPRDVHIYIDHRYIHTYGCFWKWGYPQIIHFNMVFHHKPSILGYPYFWKHPYLREKTGRRNHHFPVYFSARASRGCPQRPDTVAFRRSLENAWL